MAMSCDNGSHFGGQNGCLSPYYRDGIIVPLEKGLPGVVWSQMSEMVEDGLVSGAGHGLLSLDEFIEHATDGSLQRRLLKSSTPTDKTILSPWQHGIYN